MPTLSFADSWFNKFLFSWIRYPSLLKMQVLMVYFFDRNRKLNILFYWRVFLKIFWEGSFYTPSFDLLYSTICNAFIGSGTTSECVICVNLRQFASYENWQKGRTSFIRSKRTKKKDFLYFGFRHGLNLTVRRIWFNLF